MKKNSLSILWVLAKVTRSEILRDRVLYNGVLISVLLLLSSYLASLLSYGDPTRVVLNLGLTSIHLSSLFLVILIGSGLIRKEMDRRTAWVAFTKPISRTEFLIGKFLGLMQVLFLHICLLSFLFLSIYFLTGGVSRGSEFSQTLFFYLILVFFQAFLLGTVAVFFSCFTTASLSVILSFGVMLSGLSSSQFKFLALKSDSEIFKNIVEGILFVIPHLEELHLHTQVTYALPVTLPYVMYGVGYAIVYSAVFLFLGGKILVHKES